MLLCFLREPILLKALTRSRSIIRIFREHLSYELHSRWIYLLKCLEIIIWFFILDHLDQPLEIIINERLHSTKHHIEYDTGTPDINLIGIRLACEHFWRTELHHASVWLHHLFLWVVRPSDVEIDDEHLVVSFPYKYVRRLEVSMYDQFVMKILETVDDLYKELLGLVLTVGLLLNVKQV